MTFKLGPNQEKWLHDLETTTVKQGVGELHNLKDDSWCCLGRLCVVCGIKENVNDHAGNFGTFGGPERCSGGTLPRAAREAVFIKGTTKKFWTLNDDRKLTFPQIAKAIRAEPEKFFTEPA